MPKMWMQQRVEMEKALKEMAFGYLGISNNGQPYVIPMSYAYHENRIYLHAGLQGLKLEYIKNNPQVCFTVAELQQLIPNHNPCEIAMRYRSVMARGKANLVEEPDEKIAALQIIAAKYYPDADNSAIDNRKANSVAVIVIEIEEISGKYNVDK